MAVSTSGDQCIPLTPYAPEGVLSSLNQDEKLSAHALDAQGHRPRCLLERRIELGDGRDVGPVYRRDDVVRAQAVARGRAPGTDVCDEHAALAVEARITRIERHELRAVEPTEPFRLLVAVRLRQGRRLFGRSHLDVDLHLLPISYDGARDRLPPSDPPDRVAPLRSGRHLLAVDGGDHVADLNACLFRRRAGLDLADQRAAVDAEPERIGEAGQNVLNADADAASLHLAVLEQLIDDLPHHVARDR